MDAWKDLYADRKIEVADIMKHLGEEESLADPQKRENLRTALLAIAGVRGRLTEKGLAFGCGPIKTQCWMVLPSDW